MQIYSDEWEDEGHEKNDELLCACCCSFVSGGFFDFPREKLYTQATWLLFMITVAMNMGVRMQEESQKWKGAAYVGFFTVVSVLGLGIG